MLQILLCRAGLPAAALIAGLSAAVPAVPAVPAAAAAAAKAPAPAARSAAALPHLPGGDYIADKNHTNLLWMVNHLGLSHYYGRFDDINARLHIDPQNIARSKLQVEINPASVDTNHQSKPNAFNAEIAGPLFFDAAKFPQIRYESTKITLTGPQTGRVEGNLTLHGITKPVALNVRFNKFYQSDPMTKLPTLGFSATASLKRSEFGIAKYAPAVSDEVKLIIETEFNMPAAAKAAPAAAKGEKTAGDKTSKSGGQ